MFHPLLLGETIKKYRKQHQLTQAQLADKLFVSAQAVSNWERGLTPPDLENLCKLSAFFEVSVDALLAMNAFFNQKLMIGIDGGGTKTEFVLFSETGNILRRIKLPQSNPNDIGMENSCRLLAEGIDLLLQTAPSVCGIFAGIAGTSAGKNQKQLAAFLKQRYPMLFTAVDSDAVNILACGEDSENSAALICGTGSVLFLRKNSRTHRLGGWGYLFDGAGSAYDIGCAAVKAALGEQDGLHPKTSITNILQKRLQSDVWSSLDTLYKGGKAYIASFASIVFEAYAEGDSMAEDILKENCRHLANLISAAQKQYACGKSILTCGGLFENYKEVLMPLLLKYAPAGTQLIFPPLPPVYGACIECCRRMNLPLKNTFFKQFYEDYQAIIREDASC